MDYGRIIKNTFTLWYKDGPTIKYMLIYFLAGLAFMLLLVGAIFFFFGNIASTYLDIAKNSQISVGPPFVSETEIASLITGFFSNILPFLLIIVPIFIIFSLLQWFIQLLMLGRGLQVVGFKTASLDVFKFLRVIVLELWVAVAAVTSWYNRKFMYVFLGLIVLFFIGIIATILNGMIGGIILLIWLLVFLVYFIVIIYNALRLTFSCAIFLQKDQSVVQTARESWDFTQGRVGDILVALLIVGIAVAIVSFLLFIPSFILQFVLGLMNQQILSAVLSELYSLVLSPIFVALGVYASASIYGEISATKGGLK